MFSLVQKEHVVDKTWLRGTMTLLAADSCSPRQIVVISNRTEFLNLGIVRTLMLACVLWPRVNACKQKVKAFKCISLEINHELIPLIIQLEKLSPDSRGLETMDTSLGAVLLGSAGSFWEKVLDCIDQGFELWGSAFAQIAECIHVHADRGKNPKCLQGCIQETAQVHWWVLYSELICQVWSFLDFSVSLKLFIIASPLILQGVVVVLGSFGRLVWCWGSWVLLLQPDTMWSHTSSCIWVYVQRRWLWLLPIRGMLLVWIASWHVISIAGRCLRL